MYGLPFFPRADDHDGDDNNNHNGTALPVG
jgi:hypothetical protein